MLAKVSLNMGRILGASFATLIVVFLILTGPMIVENLDASEIMVIQSPISGELAVYTDPGWKIQGFGTVTKYPRRNELSFLDPACVINGDREKATRGLHLRFYDGGNAILCGTMSWVMPLDPKNVLSIHKDFRSAEAFETQAIRRSMEAAATFSGPAMSSFESAAGRRNELLQILNDQTLGGVYKTITKSIRATDIAGVEKDMQVIEIVRDEKGFPLRAQSSFVQAYNVQLLPMTINTFKYEDRVEDQIRQQQDATNAAVVAIANAKKADQDALTVEAQGRANAARAKWEQETLNAKTIADAQARVTIAQAGVEEADAFKKAEILKGQGEAERKRMVMQADGQLEKKLEALVRINSMYADAIKEAAPGAWSPTVVMGSQGTQGNGGMNATALVDLLTARTARDLGVDLRVQGSGNTK
ncbi:MAG: hypothetical protein LBT71_09300 [Azoarcus sp.]|jgi:hypothetical protein|nr:hypothetical protein [Azoarcus sp.]